MRRALLAMMALGPTLAAAETIPVRTTDHPGHVRLVFDWPKPPAYSIDRQAERVLLRFPSGSEFRLPDRLPRNLVSATEEADGLRLLLRPGSRARHYRLGARVVVELTDPPFPEAAPAGPAAEPRPGEAAATTVPAPVAASAAAPQAAAAGPSAAAAPTQNAPRPAPGVLPPEGSTAKPEPSAAPRPAAQSVMLPSRPLRPARLLASPHGPPGVLLPFPAGTGAAILRRGGEVLALFDSEEALDLRTLRGDATFGALVTESLPGATLLRLPLAPPGQLRARRDAAGWVLEAAPPTRAGEAPRAVQALALEAEAGPTPRLLLRAAAPGRVVPLRDPETGLPLLVGTIRDGAESMPVGRRLPELDLPPTMLGAALLARSDQVSLQAGTDRFAVTMANGSRLTLDHGVTQPAATLALTRSFDLPALPPTDLLTRLQVLQAGIASAPPLARLAQRRAAGEAFLALGLPQEAQAMLALGFAEDPRAAADARYAALAGAAALLAGRLAEAAPLRSPHWPPSDEATLWRSALAAVQGEWDEAAPGFAATIPLLLSYPAGLRARLLPLGAQALAESGDLAALRTLLEGLGTGSDDLLLPRAMLAEVEGRTEAALALYDRVTTGRDRRSRARAVRRAVELRLATGRIDAAQAASALEAALFAWRGDALEFETRLRIASLRRDTRDGRGALALLRETAAMAPERAEMLRPAMQDAFLAALAESSPVAAVGLFDANPAMLPADARGDQAVLALADRLQALDLGDRAAALLQQVMARSAGEARAAIGLRLAGLRLADGDVTGAEAALSASGAEGLPPTLARDRAVLAARAAARRGRQEEAVASLRAFGPDGGEALSELLAEGSDWAGAAEALGGHLRATLPPGPAPYEAAQRRTLLRQAAMLALAGDEPALAALRAAHAPRMGDGPLGDAFALLTADPLRGLADLPRLQSELQLFRNLPTRLEALRAGAPLTR